MLKIKVPHYSINEIDYVLDYIFSKTLNVEYIVEIHNEDSVCILSNDKVLIITTSIFKKLEFVSYKKNINYFPKYININGNDIFTIDDDDNYNFENNTLCINSDIFGSIFIILSRYEEYFAINKDSHERIHSNSLLSLPREFLDTPVVDLNVTFISYFFNLTFQRKNAAHISCDLDNPYLPIGLNPTRLVKRMLGDIIIRKSFKMPFITIINYFLHIFNVIKYDPYVNNIKYLIEFSKIYNFKIYFNLIVDNSGNKLNGIYNIKEKIMSNIINIIQSSTSILGLHLSYDSFTSSKRICSEIELFHKLYEPEVLNIRTHYLRWDSNITPYIIIDNIKNKTIDTSLGFEDYIGFRCGTGNDYKWYNLNSRSISELYIRPLIIMDCVLYESMNIKNKDDSVFIIKKIIENSKKYNSNFSLLWHNSYFDNNSMREIFEYIIIELNRNDFFKEDLCVE